MPNGGYVMHFHIHIIPGWMMAMTMMTVELAFIDFVVCWFEKRLNVTTDRVFRTIKEHKIMLGRW